MYVMLCWAMNIDAVVMVTFRFCCPKTVRSSALWAFCVTISAIGQRLRSPCLKCSDTKTRRLPFWRRWPVSRLPMRVKYYWIWCHQLLLKLYHGLWPLSPPSLTSLSHLPLSPPSLTSLSHLPRSLLSLYPPLSSSPTLYLPLSLTVLFLTIVCLRTVQSVVCSCDAVKRW